MQDDHLELTVAEQPERGEDVVEIVDKEIAQDHQDPARAEVPVEVAQPHAQPRDRGGLEVLDRRPAGGPTWPGVPPGGRNWPRPSAIEGQADLVLLQPDQVGQGRGDELNVLELAPWPVARPRLTPKRIESLASRTSVQTRFVSS